MLRQGLKQAGGIDILLSPPETLWSLSLKMHLPDFLCLFYLNLVKTAFFNVDPIYQHQLVMFSDCESVFLVLERPFIRELTQKSILQAVHSECLCVCGQTCVRTTYSHDIL